MPNKQQPSHFNKNLVIGGVNQTIIEEDINAIDEGEDGIEPHMYNSVMVDQVGLGVGDHLEEQSIEKSVMAIKMPPTNSKIITSGA